MPTKLIGQARSITLSQTSQPSQTSGGTSGKGTIRARLDKIVSTHSASSILRCERKVVASSFKIPHSIAHLVKNMSGSAKSYCVQFQACRKKCFSALALGWSRLTLNNHLALVRTHDQTRSHSWVV